MIASRPLKIRELPYFFKAGALAGSSICRENRSEMGTVVSGSVAQVRVITLHSAEQTLELCPPGFASLGVQNAKRKGCQRFSQHW